MLTSDTYRKLYSFDCDLHNSTVYSDKSADYRTRCLNLIKKHFGFQFSSFNLLDMPASKSPRSAANSLDNVTLGLPQDMLREYYKTFNVLDPLSGKPYCSELYRLSDVMPGTEFEKTDYFKHFYKKYGIYYQVGGAVQLKNVYVGTLSFLRTKAEGDFTDKELELISHILKNVAPGLIRSSHTEKLLLEKYALREQCAAFPVAQLVLDSQYNTVHANELAADYCKQLTGALPDQFKHFFVNKIVRRMSLREPEKDIAFTCGGFQIKACMRTMQNKVVWLVYLMKNTAAAVEPIPDRGPFEQLSIREREVAALMLKGMSNEMIASNLFISIHTVKSHIQRIYKKSMVSNKASLLCMLHEQEGADFW